MNLLSKKEMILVSTTKLNKWGNSQGVLIPKALCESAGFQVGDRVEMAVNPETRRIELFAACESAKR